MSGMFTIQKCRKQFNKYLSRILWGPASAGLLSNSQIWILCKSASPSTQNRWRSNNVQRLCWHCQLTSGKQNKSREHVKTRAERPRERSENIPFIKRPLSAWIGQAALQLLLASTCVTKTNKCFTHNVRPRKIQRTPTRGKSESGSRKTFLS